MRLKDASRDGVFAFVYGTLKSGYGNEAIIRRTCNRLGEAVLSGQYFMVEGGFPMIFSEDKVLAPALREQLAPVAGELWVGSGDLNEDQVLSGMDRLEGHPNFYTRVKRKVVFKNREVDAWVYEIRNTNADDRRWGRPSRKNEEGHWLF